MRVLVVGGTQFMGLSAVKRLVRDGHDVTVFHRGNRCDALPSSVRHIHGDSFQLSNFRDEIAAAEPDAVLHMVLWRGSDARELTKTLEGIEARLVVASSGNVYRAYSLVNGWETAEPTDVVYSEDGPLRKHRFAEENGHDEKIAVEQVVMESRGPSTAVIRLPAVHGPNDQQHRGYSSLWRMDQGRPYILLNDVHAGWKWARGYVDNMVDALLLALFDDRAAGKIYNVAEQVAQTQKEWIEELGRAAGWRGQVIAAPEVPPTSNADFRHNLTTDSSLIRRELGYEESVGRQEWVRRMVEWLRSDPPAPEEAEKLRSGGLSFAEEDRLARELGLS